MKIILSTLLLFVTLSSTALATHTMDTVGMGFLGGAMGNVYANYATEERSLLSRYIYATLAGAATAALYESQHDEGGYSSGAVLSGAFAAVSGAGVADMFVDGFFLAPRGDGFITGITVDY